MKDHRQRIYQERRDLLFALKGRLRWYYDHAKRRGYNRLLPVVEEVYELLYSFTESREWPSSMENAINELREILLQFSTEGLSANQLKKLIAHAAERASYHYEYWAGRVDAQKEFVKRARNTMRPELFSFLWELYPDPEEEFVFEIDKRLNCLNIFFGGEGHPLGPGHGHIVVDITTRQVTYSRLAAN